MKLGLTDIQYNSLLTVLQEQGETPAAEPEKGTSDKQSGGQGYPAVGKWESGVTRGPGNQVGVTKWSDVVGAKLTRGKANPLKEQEETLLWDKGEEMRIERERKTKEENGKVDEFNSKYYVLDTIPGYNPTNSIVLPKSVGSNQTEVWFHNNNSNTKLNDYFYRHEEFRDTKAWQVPNNRTINEMLPEGTLKSFRVNGIWYGAHLKLDEKYKNQTNAKHDSSPIWRFMGYVSADKQTPYKQELYVTFKDIPVSLRYKEKGWWEKFGNHLLIAGQFLVFFIFPESIALWVALGIDTFMVLESASKGDKIGIIIGTICAFLPFIGPALGVGVVTSSQARRLTSAIKDCKTEEEILRVINESKRLTQNDRYLLQNLIEKDPEQIAKLIDGTFNKKIKELRNLNTPESKEQLEGIYDTVKQLYETGKIDKVKATNFYKRFGYQKGMFALGGFGGIVLLQTNLNLLKQAKNIINKDHSETETYKVHKRVQDLEETFLMLSNQLSEDNLMLFGTQVEPTLLKYQKLCENQFKDKLEGGVALGEIGNELLRQYIKNNNTNFESVANNQFQYEIKSFNEKKENN